MADELQNARIDQLPQSAGPKPGFFLAMRNMELGITERIEVDYFLTSTSTQNFEWITDHEYAIGDVVTRSGRWWQALQINENIIPGTDPLTWVEVSKSPSGFVFWVAGIFTEDDVFVLYNLAGNIGIYYLVDPTRPFVSSDFEAELTAGDWVEVSAGQSHFKGVFASEAALDLAFPSAEPGDYAIVDTGGTEAALYIWDDTDTDWVASGVTTVVPPWNDTTAGLVERSTQAEAEAIATQVAAGAVGTLSASRAPSEVGLYHLFISFLTKALTWAAQQTFTAAIKLSSTTADQFLRTNGTKEVVSVAAATAAEIHTGTDNTKPATSQSIKGHRNLSRQTVAPSAGILTLPLGSDLEEARFEVTTAISSATEIQFSGGGSMEVFLLHLPIIGGVAFQMPTSVVVQESDTRFVNGTKILTLTAGAGTSHFQLSFTKRGSVYELVPSTKIPAS